MKALALISAAAIAMVAASSASAQVGKDSEQYKLALSGTVASNCELLPEGSGTYNVNMSETGNQGVLTIAYSCNSPYTVSLQSLNGGMRHAESNGSVNVRYDVEASFLGLGIGATSTSSTTMKNAPVVIVNDNDWTNILLNGGTRTGNLDLQFNGLTNYEVAGTYSDELTITLAANF
jgi:type 1 fimbria pilin